MVQFKMWKLKSLISLCTLWFLLVWKQKVTLEAELDFSAHPHVLLQPIPRADVLAKHDFHAATFGERTLATAFGELGC